MDRAAPNPADAEGSNVHQYSGQDDPFPEEVRMNWKRTAVVAMTAIGFAGATAFAQQAQPPQPPPMGPGMMGGYGPGYGMGQGMMGGRMMGGGFGPGMMGSGDGMMSGLWHLDLTDAQRQQVLKIQDDLRRRNWELYGKAQDEQAKLRDAYFGSGKRDRAAIIAAYRRIGDLRLQRIENSLDAAERIEGVLTQQQRDQLKRWGPWWMMDHAP
jgi:Spy/CpxP family protein refolding chaperone